MAPQNQTADAPLLDDHASRAIIPMGIDGHRGSLCEFVVSGLLPMHGHDKPGLQLTQSVPRSLR